MMWKIIGGCHMISLSKILFLNKEGDKARESWLSYVKTINQNLCFKLDELLPESLLSIDIDKDATTLQNERVKYDAIIDLACIDVSVVILYFYNNEYEKGKNLLVTTNKLIANERHSMISIENIIYWVRFLFNCYIAIIFDYLAYVVKVVIHPTSWFSRLKRDKILDTCNSYRMLINNHSAKKSEERKLNSLSSQIDNCVTICRAMSIH